MPPAIYAFHIPLSTRVRLAIYTRLRSRAVHLLDGADVVVAGASVVVVESASFSVEALESLDGVALVELDESVEVAADALEFSPATVLVAVVVAGASVEETE